MSSKCRPEYERLIHKDADEKLAQLCSQIKGRNIRTMVGHGNAADEIAHIAQLEKADLIIIAAHQTTGWRRFVFGSVAERVVRLAQCPVLTIRNPREEAVQVSIDLKTWPKLPGFTQQPKNLVITHELIIP